MHIWYLRRQTARRQPKRFLAVFLTQVSVAPIGASHFQNRDLAVSHLPAQVFSGVPLLLSVTILRIVFHSSINPTIIFVYRLYLSE